MNQSLSLFRSRLLWFAALVVAVLLTYANSFHNGFEFDDSHTIVDNPAIRSLKNIPSFFTDTTTFSVLPPNRTYRPFVSTTLAIDYALAGGYKPFWFHVSTMLVYLAQLAFMFWFFRTLLRRVSESEHTDIAAFLAAAWYGLHPAMAETVNYIIQRGDIYSTAGVVASIAIYAAKPQWRKTGLYLLPFVFALLSKPPAIVLVALLPLYVVMFEATSRNRRRALTSALPSLVVGILLMWFQSAMTPKTFAPSTISNFSYCITQPYVVMRYFFSFFLPLHLSADSDLQAFASINSEALLGFFFLLVIAVAIWLTARKRNTLPIAYGLLWFLIASIPTSVYRLSEVENDHRMYMPFVGLTLAVTWTLALALSRILATNPSRMLRTAVAVTALLVLSAYAHGTHMRNAVWHDDLSLWKDNVEKNPNNGRGLMNYGLALMERGQYPAALDIYERALKLTPNYPSLEINLGIVNGALNHTDAARAHFTRATTLAPTDDQTHFFFGRWLMQTGQYDEAILQLQAATSLNPSRLESAQLLQSAQSMKANALAAPTVANADNWINVSLARYQAHDYAGSIEAAQQALKLNPKSAAAYNNIGAASAALGKWNDAIDADNNALAIDPNLTIARNNLAAAIAAKSQPAFNSTSATPEQLVQQSLNFYQAGQYRESIRTAQAALKMRPNMATAWNNIAAAHAALHEWDEAIHAAQQAIHFDPSLQIAKNNLAWTISEKQKQSTK